METVGDILERDEAPTQPKVAPPFVPAMLPDAPPFPGGGIYFGMPEEIYHALPALGSHDIQKLIASPMLFWANCTWLSEAARERKAKEEAKTETRAYRTVGRAYHCRLLEGSAEYAKRYAVHLSPEDCKDALESTDQIKAAIKAKQGKPFSKVPDTLPDGTPYERAAVKADWVAQLLALDPEAKVLSELQRQHAQANAGKEFVSFEAHEQIEIAARILEADEHCRHALVGGYPEVTLIWHCPETGVPCKARIDRLKLKALVDLKTYASRDNSPEESIRRAITGYRYNFQASHYLAGVREVKALLRRTRAGNEWAMQWAAQEEEPEWWFLFQCKGHAPISRLVRYRGELSIRIATDELRRQALRRFVDSAAKYNEPNLPWVDSAAPYDITDDDFPDWVVRI